MRSITVILTVAALLLCSCTSTKYVPVESEAVRTDTVYSVKFRVDSVMFRDSVSVRHEGDTVVITRYKDRYRVRERVDTIIQSVTDSVKVRVPYPIERQLSRWEQAKMDFGGFAMAGFVIVLCVAVAWLIKKFRK